MDRLAHVGEAYAVYQPKRIKKTAQVHLGKPIDVAGVVHHQADIDHARQVEGEALFGAFEWETNNPHDPWAVRVSLLVKGALVPIGHVPAAISEQVAGLVQEHAKKGILTVAAARIVHHGSAAAEWIVKIE